MTPRCTYCGRRDSWPRMLLRARRLIRTQRAAMRELRADVIVARAGWDHEKAQRLDAEARERRASAALDFLVQGRFEGIAKRNSEGAA